MCLSSAACEEMPIQYRDVCRKQVRAPGLKAARRLQYPLIKGYALNHIRDPTII